MAFALAILGYISSANEGKKTARALAVLASAFAFLGFCIEISFWNAAAVSHLGPGFWVTGVAVSSLVVFIIYITHIMEMEEVETKSDKRRKLDQELVDAVHNLNLGGLPTTGGGGTGTRDQT